MIFNSYNYLLFLPAVFLIYYFSPKRLRWVVLLVASYYFYMSWNARYATLMLLSTVVTYVFPLLSWKTQSQKHKKLLLGSNILFNLSILFVFKYLNFASKLISDIASLFIFNVIPIKFNLILPIGISFYTFQALSYSIDVHTGKTEPVKHFGKYVLFVSFFPTLLAGPIQRITGLFPQIEESRRPDIGNIKYGLSLILWGLFKKMVIADRLSVFVNTVYNKPADYNGMEILIATVFFTFQIYCDFSGYSDMAIGSAQILGFNLLRNFNRPYLARSVTEFWKRWHISLTSWFRDYLYIPLGGNRRHHLLNILIVFGVSGLWHGASMTFIIWGLLNGIYQIGEKLTKPYFQKAVRVLNIDTETVTYKTLKTFITSVLVGFSWIFFRANNFNDLGIILGKLFSFNYFNMAYFGRIYELGLNQGNVILAVICVIFLLAAELTEEKQSVYNRLQKEPFLTKTLIYICFLLVVMVFGIYGDNQAAQFIYFQF